MTRKVTFVHCERWTGGWQSGGTPLDPLPVLKRLDAAGRPAVPEGP